MGKAFALNVADQVWALAFHIDPSALLEVILEFRARSILEHYQVCSPTAPSKKSHKKFKMCLVCLGIVASHMWLVDEATGLFLIYWGRKGGHFCSWPCAQGISSHGFRGPIGCLVIKSGLAACKATAWHTILSFQSYYRII